MATTTTPARIVHGHSTAMPGTALCGYGRPPFADTPDEVTCKNCLRVIERNRAALRQRPEVQRWNRLREEIRQERAAQDQIAADQAELGHDWASERAYGRVEALDRLLAAMERMEAD